MNRYLTELTGTFFLVLSIGLSMLGGLPMAPLAIGVTLMAMVYMGGHVSGAHCNPAVSLGLMLRGAVNRSELLPYVVAQLTGAVAGSLTVYAVTGDTFAPAPAETVTGLAAVLVEVLYTTALVLVIMNVATPPGNGRECVLRPGHRRHGHGGHFCGGGPISGGAFNPAVGIGPAVVHAILGGGSLGHVWLYIVGPCAGATIAAAIFRVQHGPSPKVAAASVAP